MLAATAVLVLHLVVIAFNIFGLIAIPLGAWRGWAFVRRRGWRIVHIGSLGIVAVQAVMGEACFLTIWEDALRGTATTEPMIARWINAIIYWPLPLWGFAIIYVAVLLYALALWRWVPPRPASAR
jgi:hypothetical protein